MRAGRLSASLLAVVVAMAIAASTTPILPVGAQSAGGQLSDARRRLRELRSSFGEATEAYLEARGRWNDTRYRLERTEDDLARTLRQLDKVQRLLNMRIARLYRTPDFGYVEVILGAADFRDFISGMDFLARVGKADADLVRSLKRLKRRIRRQRVALRGLEKEQRSRSAVARGHADALRVSLAAQKETYRRLKRAAEIERRARSVGARGDLPSYVSLSKGFVFPVDGPHSYSDDWGNPRSGGRSHKGCDIFADFGTPAVACVPGSVRARGGGLGGLAIWLSGDDGNSYYYAHLQGFEVSGGRVSQGQVIGRVGDTGNARGGAPHLHFEIHPGHGSAINPYPILAAAD